jgi:hypothetical protein
MPGVPSQVERCPSAARDRRKSAGAVAACTLTAAVLVRGHEPRGCRLVVEAAP